MKYRYDFHIHSALSPCAEEEMTPNNIVNMAVLAGLDLIAVTDHNSAGNLAAVAKCAEGKPLLFLPGIEVESAEEVHVSCLFGTVEEALEMGRLVKEHLLPVPNQEEIFGPQYLMDWQDRIVGKEKQLLLVSADLTVEEIFAAARRLSGCAYFSHVDRDSYSVLSVLGTFPAALDTGVVEVSDSETGRAFAAMRKDLKGKTLLYGTDSHRLSSMSRGENVIDIPVSKQRIQAKDVIDWINEKDLR